MKTFTAFFTLVGPIAGVVAPGFAAAGYSISPFAVAAIGLALLAVFAYALRPRASVDQVRTGSSTATNYFAASPAVVAKRVPASRPARQMAAATRATRRVSAIVEIAA